MSIDSRTDQVELYRLGKFERTPGGGVRVPASIARVGIQQYDGVSEYRDPDQVFDPESLASLAFAPVTIGHPKSRKVDASNWKAEAVGSVVGAPRREGDWIVVDLLINDAATQRALEQADLAEVSAGYDCKVVPGAGYAPSGMPFSARQERIRFNHIALLPPGGARAGRGARVRLDGHRYDRMRAFLDFDNVSIWKGIS